MKEINKMKTENAPVGENDLAHRQDGRTQGVEIGENSTRPSCSVQRLVLPFVSLSAFEDWLIRSTGCEDQVIFVEGIIRDLGELLRSEGVAEGHLSNESGLDRRDTSE